ncbi:hypothetical protein LEP1GSC194_1928 [Leptospira alstonii serovar Sichuan str. 79601]|uniref:Uncharacterized protein n=1 Tax=Leptospira alstonii serovar Sichuan str. 79601 TaxID=1218565 RepID=M6D353_9LEPT|nr:hypothetical protein LEP1GSC194_1928 [Leptospira alstonii serovar Sichuan str. 79601]
MDRRGRDGGVVNKLGMKAILCITFFACNLLTGAENPVREAEPPYPLIPKHYSLEALRRISWEETTS